MALILPKQNKIGGFCLNFACYFASILLALLPKQNYKTLKHSRLQRCKILFRFA